MLESRISKFLARRDFDGFNKRDLFIKRLIDNPWGQDIAALSNMSEGYLNLARSGKLGDTCLAAVERIISLATAPALTQSHSGKFLMVLMLGLISKKNVKP